MLTKVAHYYWGLSPLSYLRYLTIKSFRKYNPTWEIRYYTPSKAYHGPVTWVSHSHKLKYEGQDYSPLLKKLEITPITVDFRHLGFRNDLHDAYRSDFLRWYLLNDMGGFWSDMDVIFFKPLPEEIFDEHGFCITADTEPTVYYIAFIYSRKNSYVSKKLLQAAKDTQHFDRTNYQCLGNVLVAKCFPNPINPYMSIFNPAINLPIKRISTINLIFESQEVIRLNDSVGLHWFGGHPMATKWENILTENTIANCDNNLCKLIRSIGIC